MASYGCTVFLPKVPISILCRVRMSVSAPQIARHPKTGAPIRIVTTDASVWRDQKTLVWLEAGEFAGKEVPPWSRWDMGVTSTASFEAAEAAGYRPDIVACLEGDFEDWHAWLKAGHWEKVRLLVVTKALVTHIGMEGLLTLRIGNMVCLDEMAELYPFTGAVWDGTLSDAQILVALVLHAGLTFPVTDANTSRTALATHRGLRIEATLHTPPPLILLGQYYIPEKGRRRKEIDACLQANLACPLIDRIVLLNEKACAPAHPKIQEVILGRRLGYADVLRWIATEAPADAIVAFANSDIFFDAASLRLLWSVNLKGKFLALLRWDVGGTDADALAAAKLFGPRADSQDTWIVSAASVQAAFGSAPSDADLAPFQFPFGQGGCDNAITVEMFRKKFIVANPALSLKTYHYHTSAVRGYDPTDIVSKPLYIHVQPTGLHDMRPDMLPVPAQATRVEFKRQSFARPVTGPLTAAQAATFCRMVDRTTGGAVRLNPFAQNVWTPAPVQVYDAKEVVQTREGLVYGYDSIFVGRGKASTDAWGKSQLSSMAASLPVKHAMIAPLPDDVANDTGRYVLEYLGKVFALRAAVGAGAGEFWCTKQPLCIEAIKEFDWPQKVVPVISRDDTHQTWCDAATVWPYVDEPAGFVSREEVGALRAALGGGGWVPKPAAAAADAGPKRLVWFVDGEVITDTLAEEVEEAVKGSAECTFVWPGRTTLSVILDLLRGAGGIVVASKELAAWTWVLPVGAAVWEVQSEMKPSADLLHLCAAAELNHRLVITPKGATGAVAAAADAQKLMDILVRDIRTLFGQATAVVANAQVPTLIMPAGHNGRFEHAGDSFREMARLWDKKGFVKLTQSGTTKQVWLGEVGDVLLYDRPTLEWLKAAPADEQVWRRALFGNPVPPVAGAGQGPTVPWTFWPRRPLLVENAVAAGLPDTPFSARPDRLAFYGRSENAIQKGNRTRYDWSSACDKFHHVDGLGAYPFTQEEYLAQLAKARFGLCLAGYGRKCHREVECMAMGCVPVVAPEVDMTSYAEPPQAGVHYFRVETPAEADHVARTTSEERWATMSAACRAWWERNASVEGSWRLTERLLI